MNKFENIPKKYLKKLILRSLKTTRNIFTFSSSHLLLLTYSLTSKQVRFHEKIILKIYRTILSQHYNNYQKPIA